MPCTTPTSSGRVATVTLNRPRQMNALSSELRRRLVSTLDALAADDRVRIVTRALEELPIEQREVVVLHLQADMTFRRIASMLGLSINTVQSRYRYGMEKLRILMNGELEP